MDAIRLEAFSDELTKIAEKEKPKIDKRMVAGMATGAALGAGAGYAPTLHLRRALRRAGKLVGEKVPADVKKGMLKDFRGGRRALFGALAGLSLGSVAAHRGGKGSDGKRQSRMSTGMLGGAALGGGLGAFGAQKHITKQLDEQAKKVGFKDGKQMVAAVRSEMGSGEAKAARGLMRAAKHHVTQSRVGLGASLGAMAGLGAGGLYHAYRRKKDRG